MIAIANADLRSLYRPIWDYTLKYLWCGAIAGFVLKAIDTTMTIFSLNKATGIVWLVILGSLLSAKDLPFAPFIAMIISLKFGVKANLFITVLTTIPVGFLFGAPLVMVVGTVLGHFKRIKAAKAPDVISEGRRLYILGILAPIIFLMVLIPLYYWFNIKMLDRIQK